MVKLYGASPYVQPWDPRRDLAAPRYLRVEADPWQFRQGLFRQQRPPKFIQWERIKNDYWAVGHIKTFHINHKRPSMVVLDMIGPDDNFFSRDIMSSNHLGFKLLLKRIRLVLSCPLQVLISKPRYTPGKKIWAITGYQFSLDVLAKLAHGKNMPCLKLNAKDPSSAKSRSSPAGGRRCWNF